MTTILYRPVGPKELALIEQSGWTEYLSKFEVQNVGGQIHNELWVPAEELEEFNSNIVGQIEVTKSFYPTDK
jgi:hypothetical protein